MAKREFAQADAMLKPIEKAFPNAVPVLMSRGTIDLFLNRLPSARAAYDRAATLDPANAEVLRGQIALDLAMKKPDEARKRAEAWVEKNPTNTNGLLALAQVYGAQKDAAKVEATLKRIIQQNPTELTAYAMLGRVYIAQNRLDEARQAVRGRRRQAAQGTRRRDDDRHDLRDAGHEERGAAPVRESRAAGCRPPAWRRTTWHGCTPKMAAIWISRCSSPRTPRAACRIGRK